ncbi:hypothetical protein Adt_03719 [Abeliophyllum distichum]|uniref:Uncharacterized protein n=1 Tax=Abeliophyllum distichum TaxID=126358 RepID=A0ABD1VZE2_9LAMI
MTVASARDEGPMRDTRMARRVEWLTSSHGASAARPFSAFFGRTECINIGSYCDKLDLAILEMLLAPSNMVVVSLCKYWTSTWDMAVEQATLIELIKMVEMNTARDRVLNSTLYSMLANFEKKFDKVEAKTKKLANDLRAMGTKNTKLGSENEALLFNVEASTFIEDDLKVKLESAAEEL